MDTNENAAIIERIKNACSKPIYREKDVASHVSGFKRNTNEVELTYTDQKLYVKIDDLEKELFNPDTLTVEKKVEPISNQNIAQVQNTNLASQTINQPNVSDIQTVQPQVEQPIQPQAQVQPQVAQATPEPQPTTNITLNDIKTLSDIGNKATLDNILKSIASTQTGDVDINKIVDQVASNLISETTKSINENKNVSTELYKYDKLGKIIIPEEESMEQVDALQNEVNGFNNLMIYIEAAKLYGVNYTDEQINMAKQNFVNSVNNGLVQKDKETIAPTVEAPKTKKLEPITNPVPVDSEKAGFADVFILVVIIGIYAAIIINLVMKLK